MKNRIGKLNIRKLNNRDGKSILMALLLLLVAVTVSIVIITAATSAAHQAGGSRQQQQAYLTVSSAAELLRGSLSGKEYTYTYKEYTRTQGWRPSTKTETSEAVSPDKEMTEFITEVSRIIRDDAAAGAGLIFSKTANITAEKADAVSADFSLRYTGHNSGTENYELLIRMEIPGADDESSGYRMEMRLPITRSKTTDSGVTTIDGQQWNLSSSITAVKWGNAVISKGWTEDE